jgi:hypothetical protein
MTKKTKMEHSFPHNHDNDEYDDHHHHDQEPEPQPASSPFRYDVRDETVYFQKMRAYMGAQQQRGPSAGVSVRHQFLIEEEDEPLSSPFRAEACDENDMENEENHVKRGSITSPRDSLTKGQDTRV